MMKIKKVLNSSVILAIDEMNQEFVCVGKGIGYGRKIDDVVDNNNVDQIFMPIENAQTKEYVKLLDSISPVYLDITHEVVSIAEKELGTKLNMSIFFTLSDHLSFAVERVKKNIEITNRVYWEIKNYYPIEFEIGVGAIKLLKKETGIDLPKEEAANIAFHIINAQSESKDSRDGMKYAKLIGGIVNTVVFSSGKEISNEGLHYQRFITHVKFFVERFFNNKLLSEEDCVIFDKIATLYPEAMGVAFKIKEYIASVYNDEIPKEELVYLAIHIHRLQSYKEIEK